MSKTPPVLLAAAALLSLGAAVPHANAANPVLEPTTQKFLDGLAGTPPIYTHPPEEMRGILHKVQSGDVNKPAVDSEERTLPVGPSGKTKVRIVKPAGAKGTLPGVIYFHGAGWVMGDQTTHDLLVRRIATEAGATVIFVDYDRSPEAKYPVAIEQDYAVTEYVAKHAGEFGVDAKRLAIAGDSVGGNMTAVVALLAKERKGPELKAQVLFYPVTDAAMNDGSFQEFANGPWLTAKAMDYFWNQYEPDQAKRADVHISPLNATTEQLKGQPQALVITAENDVLRDEGEAYARKLTEAGVRTTVTRYNNTIHDFVMLNALGNTPAAEAAVTQASTFLRDALNAR